MLRAARDKDGQSLEVYSDDECNTALAGRINMLGKINAASRESSEIHRETPGRQPVTLRQLYWKHTHLWPARVVSCAIQRSHRIIYRCAHLLLVHRIKRSMSREGNH